MKHNPNINPVNNEESEKIRTLPIVEPVTMFKQPEVMQIQLDEPVTMYKEESQTEDDENVTNLPVIDAYDQIEPEITYQTNYTVEKAGENLIKYST